MKLISFDAMRTLGIPGAVYIKADEMGRRTIKTIQGADVVLFPEYWQVHGIHYGLKKQIFPSIGTYHIGHDKIEMTRVVQLLWPQNMPETQILAASEWAREKVLERFDFPFVAKNHRSSMGSGVWFIENQAEWEQYAGDHDTWYVQEYLPIDRDLRLVVVGRKVIGAYWRHRPHDGFHTNVSRGGYISVDGIPDRAVSLVEEMAQRLDIDHAGFDVAQVDGRCYFFEFNRLFGSAGLLQQGISLGPLIFDYLVSRYGTGRFERQTGCSMPIAPKQEVSCPIPENPELLIPISSHMNPNVRVNADEPLRRGDQEPFL